MLALCRHWQVEVARLVCSGTQGRPGSPARAVQRPLATAAHPARRRAGSFRPSSPPERPSPPASNQFSCALGITAAGNMMVTAASAEPGAIGHHNQWLGSRRQVPGLRGRSWSRGCSWPNHRAYRPVAGELTRPTRPGQLEPCTRPSVAAGCRDSLHPKSCGREFLTKLLIMIMIFNMARFVHTQSSIVWVVCAIQP